MTNITILTPTYNRCEKLSELYDSLVNQNCKNFIWLIIDDGSTDNTEYEVSSWQKNGVINIVYFKKNNGGKHTALNYAYQYIATPLTFIVDSDDIITPEAITVIEGKYSVYKDEMDLCGFSFLRGKHDGGYLSSSAVPTDDMKESYCECRLERNIGGDMAEVWFTRCLREFQFPEFEGEKFIGEDIVWVKMASKYKMRFYNNVIYISNYLEDGLTCNRRKHNIQSPKGCMARAIVFLNANVPIKWKIKSILQYQIYGKFAGKNKKELFRIIPYKALYILTFIPAQIIYRKWEKEYQL